MFAVKLIKQYRRLAKKSSRNDFLSTVVKGYEEGTVGKEEMTAHASTLTYVHKPINVHNREAALILTCFQYCGCGDYRDFPGCGNILPAAEPCMPFPCSGRNKKQIFIL